MESLSPPTMRWGSLSRWLEADPVLWVATADFLRVQLYSEKPVRQPQPQSKTAGYLLIGIIFLLLLVVGGLLGVLGSKGMLSFGSGSAADASAAAPATVTQKETVTASATSGGEGGGGKTSAEGGGSRTAAATSDREQTGSGPTKTVSV